jgi:hypothetical protein
MKKPKHAERKIDAEDETGSDIFYLQVRLHLQTVETK